MRRSWLDGMLKALADNPIVCWILLASVGIHLALTVSGIHAYRCAFRVTTGLPCPGCGVSRGILRLLKGDWTGMWVAHPFSPYLLALALVMLALATLPVKSRHSLVKAIVWLERRTHFNAVMLSAFAVHGVARLLFRAF
ncbi:MAG: DUF2752 domain-containing protein [Lentisphaerae bacterium]|nr:DUF2752 domain-containing protein [Lentisphaerota bacterium]